MKKFVAVCLVLFMTAISYVSEAHAETALKYGAALRLRQEIWDNVVDLGTGQADRNFFRMRFNLWGDYAFNKDNDIYLRLTSEPKYYFGDFKPNGARNGDRLNEDEIVMDNIYVQSKNLFGLPVDVKIGRQDFLGAFGEMFLIADGTPGDGSRTFYFNAARATVKLGSSSNVDLVYISDPKTDTYLPSLHSDPKVQLTSSNEQGFVVYGRTKIADKVAVEPYYMYKTEKAFGSTPDLDLNTIGARVAVNIDSWKFGGEFAHQFGEYDGGTDRRGNGGYVYVGNKYDNIALKPEWELRYVYLSGDDPGTSGKVEAWDPLFSRNPNWNELMIYTYILENLKLGGALPGYWTNLNLYKVGLNLTISPESKLMLSYQYLTAPESTQGLNPAVFSNDGKTRGHLPTMIFTHKFSKNIDGMVQAEYFMPRSFYSSDNNATFLRLQLQFKI